MRVYRKGNALENIWRNKKPGGRILAVSGTAGVDLAVIETEQTILIRPVASMGDRDVLIHLNCNDVYGPIIPRKPVHVDCRPLQEDRG